MTPFEPPLQTPLRRDVVISGRYRLLEEIGRGGVGVVFRAHSLPLDIPCAIKFLLPQHMHDASARARFVREARAAAKLRSTHVVTVFDVDEWEDTPFIAMELLQGQSLAQYLRERGKLSPQQTCTLIEQVAVGLTKAHAMGLVHRDLKPDNIFVLEEQPLFIKLIDFGLAKHLDLESTLRTVTGVLVGTPYYMSPEQAMGRAVDHRSDLWSLAVVACQCLTGELPFSGTSLTEVLFKIVHAPIPKPSELNSALPQGVDAWWAHATQREPALRPSTATELAAGLRAALLGDAAPRALREDRHPRGEAHASGVASAPVRGAAHGMQRALGAAFTCAVLVGLAYWAFRNLHVDEPTTTKLHVVTPAPSAPATRGASPSPPSSPVTREASPSPSSLPVASEALPSSLPVTRRASPSPSSPAMHEASPSSLPVTRGASPSPPSSPAMHEASPSSLPVTREALPSPPSSPATHDSLPSQPRVPATRDPLPASPSTPLRRAPEGMASPAVVDSQEPPSDLLEPPLPSPPQPRAAPVVRRARPKPAAKAQEINDRLGF